MVIFLRTWKERLNPDKETLKIAPIKIRMYSLPMEYWKEEIMMDIGNTLRNIIKVSKKTRQQKYISYAWICIYVDIFRDLPKGIELSWQDEKWFQAINYEQISFICRRWRPSIQGIIEYEGWPPLLLVTFRRRNHWGRNDTINLISFWFVWHGLFWFFIL